MSKTPLIRDILAATKVNVSRGAPMGQSNFQNTTGRLHLQRVPLDSGGYAPNGAYWGLGEPLYCAFNPEDDCYDAGMGTRIYVRALNRRQAKSKVLELATPPVQIQ